MTVVTDYATLLDGVRRELADLLPDIHEQKRAQLLDLLAKMHASDTEDSDAYLPELSAASTSAVPEANAGDASYQTIRLGDQELTVPPPKTPNVDDMLDDENLDRLQPRISQGVFTNYIPPDVIWRIRCDVDVTPITLTGQRQVLSIGRRQRQFPDPIRRAILARDRGCAVPGCHWAASLCELHHVQYWSQDGETSTDNGVVLCAHHHQALHAGQLKIDRVHGEFRFVLHRLIDPAQRPRKNLFFQT